MIQKVKIGNMIQTSSKVSYFIFPSLGDAQVTAVVTKAQYSLIGCPTLGKSVPGKLELAAKSIPGSKSRSLCHAATSISSSFIAAAPTRGPIFS